MARLHRRRLPVLHERAREPLRAGGVHGTRPRWRLRGVRGRRRALLLPDPRRLPRRAGRAALVRGADRLPLAGVHRRRRAPRAVRVRRVGAHHRPGRGPPGPAGVRLHAARRSRDSGLRARARRGMGRWLGRAAARAARRRDHLCSRRAARPTSSESPRRRRRGRLRRDPHERHSSVPVRAALARALDPVGRKPHAPRRRGVPGVGAAGPRAHAMWTTYPLGDANAALDDLRHGRFTGAAVLLP